LLDLSVNPHWDGHAAELNDIGGSDDASVVSRTTNTGHASSAAFQRRDQTTDGLLV